MNCLNTLPRELQAAGRLAEAGQWTAANQVARAVCEADVSAESGLAWAACLVQHERWRCALEWLLWQHELALATADRRREAAVCALFAVVYRRVGDVRLAGRFQRRALQLVDDLGPEELTGLAQQAIVERRWRTAELLLETACLLAADTNETGTETALLGLLAEQRGDDAAAIDYLVEARRRHRIVGDLSHVAADNVNLAVLLGRLGRRRSERRLLMQAEQLYRQSGQPQSMLESRRMRRLVEEAGKMEQAAAWN